MLPRPAAYGRNNTKEGIGNHLCLSQFAWARAYEATATYIYITSSNGKKRVGKLDANVLLNTAVQYTAVYTTY